MGSSCKRAEQRNLMWAALSAFALTLAMGCGNAVGGSGGYLIACSTEAPCTLPLVCTSGYCQLPSTDIQAGGDAQTALDAAATDDAAHAQDGLADATFGTDSTTASDAAAPADVVDSQNGADGLVNTDTQVAPDAAPQPDAAVLPDAKDGASSADSGPDDANNAGDATPAPTTILALQQAAFSLQCGTPDGVSSHGLVSLSSVVVTGPLVVTGSGSKKIQTFHVRPNPEPALAPYAGLTVVTPGSALTLQAGDVIDLSGEVQEFYCLTELYVAKPADIKLIGKLAPPLPYEVAWSALSTGNIEALEGVLLTVPAAKVVDPALPGTDGKPHGEALLVSPGGITLAIGFGQGSSWVAADQTTLLKAGQGVQSVTGQLQFSFGKYLLRLRSDTDFVL